jgi:4-methoxybenzoate monooxygenase (O-demethylating)
MNCVRSGPAIRRLREAFQAEAERLVEELASRGEFDAVKDLAIVYPLKVVGDTAGVPPQGRELPTAFQQHAVQLVWSGERDFPSVDH